MADVLLSINGIGQGHLMRGLKLCQWLRRSGRRPVVMHQGRYPDSVALKFPGVSIPTIYAQSSEVQEQIRDQIAAIAQITSASLVIEDTHPAHISLPDGIKRLLVVRPTVMDFMRRLRHRYGNTYGRFLVCDHPQSPTWPYCAEETREILAWKGFECIGPIYQRTTEEDKASVRRRYNITPGRPMLVFTLGGGGEKPESGDRASFLARAEQIATEYLRLQPEARLLFVCGPLFPVSLPVPAIFERVQQEAKFPSLLAYATGAVIRPGFNTLWECVANGIPFVPLLGTTYMEPTDRRLETMKQSGLLLPGNAAELADMGRREAFREACEKISAEFSGSPRTRFLEVVEELAPVQRAGNATQGSCRAASSSLSYSRAQTSEGFSDERFLFFLQLNGVNEEQESLRWLADLLRRHDLYLSLGVIPYLSRLNRKFLDRIDPEGRMAVLMHGFCHLRRSSLLESAAEFTNSEKDGAWIEKQQLRLGFRYMRLHYRERFCAGFSAPFDAIPVWLPHEWKRLGGAYLSGSIGTALRMTNPGLAIIELTTQRTELNASILRDSVGLSLRTKGRAGIMLNDHLLATEAGRVDLEALLTAILTDYPTCAGAPIQTLLSSFPRAEDA